MESIKLLVKFSEHWKGKVSSVQSVLQAWLRSHAEGSLWNGNSTVIQLAARKRVLTKTVGVYCSTAEMSKFNCDLF